MRLLLEVGYQKLLFAKGAPVAALIEAIGDAQVVQSEGYGSDVKYTPESNSEIVPRLIPEDAISLPDNDSAFLDKYYELKKSKDELSSKVYKLEQQLKEINAAVQQKQEGK